METPAWRIEMGHSPLVAAALHDGHAVREELRPWLALSEPDRLREEDPFTASWTAMAPTSIVGLRSRFEVDLNRPQERAVYLDPSDAWGLTVWKETPPAEILDRSRRLHTEFYRHVRRLFETLVAQHEHVVVFDLHSYNHRRQGEDGPDDDQQLHPDVNVGTGTMDRQHWAPVVECVMERLSSFDFLGRRLDVRENIKFFGGYFPRSIHEQFPRSVCTLALEFKKFFMDEWTGRPYAQELGAIRRALSNVAEGVAEELARFGRSSPR